MIAGAGDIAGEGSGDDETARLLDRIDPDVVFTTGDNVYSDGTLSEYRTYYDPTGAGTCLGRGPVPGTTITTRKIPPDTSRISALGHRLPTTRTTSARGTSSRSTWRFLWQRARLKYEWLEKDLAASDAICTIAYWHEPRDTAGTYDDLTFTVPLWQLLYAKGVELVLNGHDHNYQRYRPMDPYGKADVSRGIREIVVGTGGGGLYKLHSDRRRDAGEDRVYGALEETLRPSAYDWQFRSGLGRLLGLRVRLPVSLPAGGRALRAVCASHAYEFERRGTRLRGRLGCRVRGGASHPR